MKKLAAIVVVAALIAVGIWFLQRDGAEPDRTADPHEADAGAPERAQLEGTQPEGMQPEETALATPEAKPKEVDPEAALEAGRRDGSISGTVRFEDGTKPKAFRFMIYRRNADGSKGGWQVEGTNGVFTGPSIGPGPREIESVNADGGEHAPTQTMFDVQIGGSIAIVLKRSATVGIRVVDAESRALLRGAYALKASAEWPIGGTGSPELWMPGEYTLRGERIHADDDGVIELPPFIGATKWFFRADGYAWRHATVRSSSATPLEIGLVPGGGVDILVRQWREVDRAVLIADVREKLERFGHPGSPPTPSEQGQIRIDGLPEGPLSFFVGRRGAFLVDKLYGSGRVEIVRDRMVPLTIELDVDEPVDKAPLIGTLTIPLEWGRIETSLFFQGAQGGATSGHRARVRFQSTELGKPWAFETEPLPVGNYVAWVRGAAWRAAVEHKAGEEVHLVVPAPVTHQVRVTDASGASIPAAVCKYTGIAKGVASWRWEVGKYDETTETFRLRLAPGTVRLLCMASGYVPKTSDIDVPEHSDRTTAIELERGAGVRVGFRVGDEPVAPQGFRVWASGAGIGKGLRARGGVMSGEGFPPGAYELRVTPMDGFETPDHTPVELVAGETKEVTIELRRVNK